MIIRFDDVSKQYKKNAALEHVNITLEEGIYGLLGPNGAGKSTFMKILTGNILQTEGKVTCDNEDISRMGKAYRKYIGYMPQQQEMYPYFTGRRFLTYMAALKGMDRAKMRQEIDEIAEKINLNEFIDKKIGNYSGGMKQRLLIAQALLGNPQVLVLDEPTAGLDPKERIRIRNLISENSKGKIVIIATHVVQDIECIADRLIMLKKGEVLAAGTPEQLLLGIKGYVYEVKLPLAQAEADMKKLNVSNVSRCMEGMKLRIVSENIPYDNAACVEPDLEDYYLYLYNERIV